MHSSAQLYLEIAGYVFRARPDITSIIHVHAPAAMAIAGLEYGLLQVTDGATLFYKRIVNLEEDLHFEDAYCKQIAEAFSGETRAVMYQNHSFVVVGRTVAESILLAYTLTQACEVQLRMHASGEKIIQPSDEKLQRNYDSFYNNPHFNYDGSLEWPALLRTLDREDPSFRD